MLKVAVVGAGVMGTNHVRILRQLPQVQVSHIVDTQPERAEALAHVVNAQAVAHVDELPGDVTAAVVAVPTVEHADAATSLMRAGVDVLVEKPIAATLAEAQELVEVARQNERVLQIGHVERFNPAVLELDRLVRDLVHIDIARISPYSGRTTDGVVLDLMTHDLDLATALAGGSVETVSAVGQRTLSDTEDLVSALLTFDNGISASLTASRIGQSKIRTVALTQRSNFIQVDLLRQDVTVTRVEHAEFLSDEGMRYRQSGVVELPFLTHRGEPLFLELQHFIECVRTRSQPRVTGSDGVRALILADMVLTALQPKSVG